MTKVNLEEELGKLRRVTEENPDLSHHKVAEDRVETCLSLAMGNNQLNRDVYRLLSYVFINSNRGPLQERKNKSIKVYTPNQLFKRIRGWKLKKRSRELKELGFNGFNIDAKNFIVNAYNIIYDAYLKEQAEQDIKTRSVNPSFRYAMRGK
jgi:hypothetical protein